jgi:hypothetical protein
MGPERHDVTGEEQSLSLSDLLRELPIRANDASSRLFCASSGTSAGIIRAATESRLVACVGGFGPTSCTKCANPAHVASSRFLKMVGLLYLANRLYGAGPQILAGFVWRHWA